MFNKPTQPRIPNRIYTNETEFIDELDGMFRNHNQSTNNKYDNLLELFKTILPIIQDFSTSYLVKSNHNVYTKFNKTYLKKIY